MRSVSVGLGLVLLVLWSSVALAVEGTVRLKNGGFIQGDVLEVLPGERVSVRTSDGSVRNIAWAEVERVDEGQPSAPAPPAPEPAPTPAPPPPPAPVFAEAPEPAPVEETHEADSLSLNPITLTLFGTFGVLGELTLDGVAFISDGSTTERQEQSLESDLAVSYGGGLQLDAPLHRHFSVAGIVRLMSWTGEDGERRALFVDFLAAPRMRYPFELSPGSLGVVFLQVPIGASYVDLPNDDDVNVSAAFSIGVSAGFMALLSQHLGISIEMGWMHRAFSVEQEQSVATATGPVTIESDSDLTMAQPFFQLGLVAAF